RPSSFLIRSSTVVTRVRANPRREKPSEMIVCWSSRVRGSTSRQARNPMNSAGVSSVNSSNRSRSTFLTTLTGVELSSGCGICASLSRASVADDTEGTVSQSRQRPPGPHAHETPPTLTVNDTWCSRAPAGSTASGSGVSDPLAFLPQFDLADLARDRHREGLPHLDIARDLEVGELAGAEFAHFLGAERVEPLLEDHPRHELFAVLLIGHADDLDVADGRVVVEELLDLARVDVLAAADDHVLDAPGDVDVAVIVHDRKVTGVDPPGRVDRFGGL